MGAVSDRSILGGAPASPVGGDDDPDGSGVFGIFSNAWGDVKDIAGGLGAIAGTVIQDVVHAASGTLIGDEFKTDDIIGAMPSAIAQDYSSRYGGGVSGIAEGIYEHPLAFLGDILTVATGGGYLAAKSAATAAKATTGIGRAAAAMGAKTVGEEAGFLTSRLLTADQVSDAANFVRRVQGVSTKMRNPITGRIEELAPAFNPVRRALSQNAFIKIISDKGGSAARQAAKYEQLFATTGDAGLAFLTRANRLRGYVNDAAVTGDRIIRPGMANMQLKRFADIAFGTTHGAARAALAASDAAVGGPIKRLTDLGFSAEDIHYTLTSAETLHVVDGYEPRVGRGWRDVEAFDAPSTDPLPATYGPDRVLWTPESPSVEQIVDDWNNGGRADVAIAIREALGDEAVVIAPEAKSVANIRLSASLVDGDLPDDIRRVRIITEDANSGATLKSITRKVEQATGGRVVRYENTVYTPDAGGERYQRLVVQMPDGNPLEVQLVTSRAAKTLDIVSDINHQTKFAEAAVLAGRDVATNAERARAGNLASQTLWGGVTADVRKGLGGFEDGVVRQSIHDLRLAVQEHLTNPGLREGNLDLLSMFQNPYLPLRFENGGTWNGSTKQLDGGGGASDLHDMTQKAGLPQPVYMPMVSAIHGSGVPGPIMAKAGGKGALAMMPDAFLKQNTGELLASGKVLVDPMKVYHLRALAATRATEAFGLVNNVVGQVGRVIHKFDDAEMGEVVLSRTHIRNLYNTRRSIEDAGLEAIQQGGDQVAHVKRALTAALVENQAALRQLPDPDLVAIPQVVYDRLQAQARIYLGPNVDLAVRTPTQLWKGMVLAGSPRWVVNNVVGNILFLKNQGGRLTDVVRQLDPKFRRSVIEAIGEDALGGGVQGGMFADAARTTGRFSDDSFAGAVANRIRDSKFGGESVPMRGARGIGSFMRGLNNSVEDAFRRASYMTAAQKVAERAGVMDVGFSFFSSKATLESVFRVGLDERNWKKAVVDVNKYLNDYNAMTPFGRSIVRPYIAPFWSFYRHATKTLLTMPFEHPARARLVALINESSEDQLDKLGPLPSWLEGSALYLGAGPDAGDARFLSTAGPNPFNAVLESPGNILSPMWKVLFEQTTGVDSFTGRAFTAPDVVGMPGMQQFKMVDGQPVPVDKVTPGIFEHLLSQIPQYNMVKDIAAGGSSYDTATLLQAMKGDATIRDEDGSPLYDKETLSTLGKLFGYSTYNIDLDAFQETRLEQIEAALTMWANRVAANAAAQ